MFYIIYKDMKKVYGLYLHKDTTFLCILAKYMTKFEYNS
jgi:hypothetical protein